MPRAFLPTFAALLWAAAICPHALADTSVETPVKQQSLISRCHLEIREGAYEISAKDVNESGLPSLQELCPETEEQLRNHQWAPMLLYDTGDMNILDLEDFFTVYQSYQQRDAITALDRLGVGAALQRLNREPAVPPSLWEQLTHWLRNWWGGQEPSEFNWLQQLSISESVIKGLFYICVALILALTAALVIREVRAVLSPRRKTYEQGWQSEDEAAPSAGRDIDLLNLDTLTDAPASQQPGLLLKVVLRQLETERSLTVRNSLTHREIIEATAELVENDDIGRLSSAAEKSVFGGWAPGTADRQELLSIARDVCRSLQGKTA